MLTIKDIFGNEIEVTSLSGALYENAQMVMLSQEMGEDHPVQWIPEYKIKKSVDQWGKTFGYSVQTNSGKVVHIKEFHSHNETELKKLLLQSTQ